MASIEVPLARDQRSSDMESFSPVIDSLEFHEGVAISTANEPLSESMSDSVSSFADTLKIDMTEDMVLSMQHDRLPSFVSETNESGLSPIKVSGSGDSFPKRVLTPSRSRTLRSNVRDNVEQSSFAKSQKSPTKGASILDNEEIRHPSLNSGHFATPVRKRAHSSSSSVSGNTPKYTTPTGPESLKRVTFMKGVEYDPPTSSPTKNLTPSRSILKQRIFEDDEFSVQDSNLEANESWIPGSIIQLEPSSERTAYVVPGCIRALSTPGFEHRFEAYASINYAIKINTADFMVRIITPRLNELIALIEADTKGFIAKVQSEVGTDAFELRAEVQTVKILGFLLSNQHLCTLMEPATLRGFLASAVHVLSNSTFSKSIVAAYLQVIRDHKVPNGIVGHPLSESLLFGVLNIKAMNSVSLMIEQIATLRNFVAKNRQIMAKNIAVWFNFVCGCLCDVGLGGNDKVVRMVSLLLVDMVVQFEDIPATRTMVFDFLNGTMKESNFETKLLPNGDHLRSSITIIEFLADRLKKLVLRGNYSVAMTIWSHVTLLLNKFTWQDGIESWGKAKCWIEVFVQCYKYNEQAACESLKAWTTFVTMISGSFPTGGDLSIIPAGVKERLGLLVSPFKLCDQYATIEVSQQFDDLYRRIYMSITKTYMRKSTSKDCFPLVNVLWECCMSPPLTSFYFTKTAATQRISLGVSMVSAMFNGRSANSMQQKSAKMLRTGFTTGQELLPLSQRWMISAEQALASLIADAFGALNMTKEERRTLLNTYMAAMSRIVPFVQNAQKAFFLKVIYHTRFLVKELVEYTKEKESFTPDECIRILLSIKDNFNIESIVLESAGSPSCCATMVSYFLDSEELALELCETMMPILGKKDLVFYSTIVGLKKPFLNDFVIRRLKQYSLSNKSDLSLLGHIIGNLDANSEFITALLKALPNVSDPSIVPRINLENWNFQSIMMFFEISKVFKSGDKTKSFALLWKPWVSVLQKTSVDEILEYLGPEKFLDSLPSAFYLKVISNLLLSELSSNQVGKTTTLVSSWISFCERSSKENVTIETFKLLRDRLEKFPDEGIVENVPGYLNWSGSSRICSPLKSKSEDEDGSGNDSTSAIDSIPSQISTEQISIEPCRSDEVTKSGPAHVSAVVDVPASNSDQGSPPPKRSHDASVVSLSDSSDNWQEKVAKKQQLGDVRDENGSQKEPLAPYTTLTSFDEALQAQLVPSPNLQSPWKTLDDLVREICETMPEGLSSEGKVELEKNMLRLLFKLKTSGVH
ncbi:unnamed protein product [Kuraishia capsulata CBS 1993]|uniref:Telomere-associated protein Rif1 N-terminal domain-containing protein n=1 Tax=Kuraishia capsulata CBS 1993 TaxID=1382522 RepID=W6MV07_9ASCO|nr:uncharacterized protein KUCA_T00005695001 [Kuraishia capsulata CBS 1993]CDK29702.1 unnamed protein product [Kuraishia capsulata CBS 1993]